MGKIERWTHSDEADLQRAIDRKDRVIANNMAPVVALIRFAGMENEPLSAESIAAGMVAQADAWRDALEPFDSGVRVAVPDA